MDRQSWKVVITDLDQGAPVEEKNVLVRGGVDLVYGQAKKEDDVIRVCREADGVITQYAQMTRAVLEQLPRCKVIARYGVGVDNIDLKAASELGIIVANVPDYCTEEVADHTLALWLGLIRKTVLYDRKVKSGLWDFREGRPICRLRGKVMGIIGCGRIGTAVAKRLQAFGVRVVGYDPFVKMAWQGIERTDLDTILRKSDFISLHCSLNETSRHLIGEKEFKKMRKKPILLNTARGPVVHEKALITALQRGLISGAGIDVMETEPPDPNNPLLEMDHVILSPHVAFYSEQSLSELKRRVAEIVLEVLSGKWPRSVVNPEVKGKTRASILDP